VRLRIGLVTLFLSAVQAFSATNITPTTTLAAETGNNTSGAATFQAQTNGNAAPGNVSKVPTNTLLYNGSTTAMYAHFMPWFGVSYHMNVGYNSADPVHVKKQVDDMISRGIAGVIIDWYGPNASQENASTLAMASEAASRNGAFQFAIMEDAGAIKNCANTSGCDLTGALISDLNYITQTYISSPAYIRWNGSPVVFYFGVESYPIDWTRVRANTPSNLQFVFQNSGAFSRSYSNGGFSWVQPSSATSSDPMSLSYLANFYSTAQQYPAKLPLGASYKGFNNTLASWSANRIMQQQCGQTWLSTFQKANSMWSTADQLAFFQLVTWNDYEEGTEIETGIDNCVSVNASVSGSTLNWSITGSESTLDHYTVFISSDGQNLMSLGDFPAGTHSLDLSSFGFNAGTYSIYVKAVGKPSILNHMSAAATYTSGGGQPQPPVARLSLSPGSGTAPMTVSASTSASTDPQGSALTSTINFGDGATAAGPTASHTYANTGNYTVTATVSDALKLQSQATATVSVTSAPALTVTQPLNNSTVWAPIHVAASGSAPSGVDALQIYLDHNLVYQINASSMDTAVAAAPGVHLVVVKLWDKLGNAYKQSVTVTVVAPLVASLSVTPASVAVGSSVQGAVSASSGTIGSSYINWGDGTQSAGPTASHSYTSAGTYTVTATAADSVKSVATAPMTITVQAPTKAGVVMQSPVTNTVVPLSMHVQGSATSPIGIVAMQIYLDGTLVYKNALSQTDTYINVSAGSHRVTLKAWDSAGASYMQTAYVTAQ